MSEVRSREKYLFIAIVALLSIVLFIGGIWAVNLMNSKDRTALHELLADYERLEKAYTEQIRKVDDGKLPYENPDSLRAVLSKTLTQIQEDKKYVGESGSKAIKQLDKFLESKNRYTEQLEELHDSKDFFAAKTIGELREEIEKFKKELAKMQKENRSLRNQLYKMINKFKGSQAELAELKKEKAKLDSLFSEQEFTRERINEIIDDKNKMQEILAERNQLIEEQKKEIERLKGLTKRAYGFLAVYERTKRFVVLDTKGKHKNKVGKEFLVEFSVGEGLFDDDDAGRVVYLTLYHQGKPYKIIKEPIRVQSNNTAKQKFELDKKFEDGTYRFVLTYKEEPIMPDYQFSIR